MTFHPFLSSLLLGTAVALLGGCITPRVHDAAAPAPRAGVDSYRLLVGSARSSTGCRYAYRVFTPDAAAGATSVTDVVLGHGFLRDQDTLVELARGLANAGLRAATLDFCAMRPWNGRHPANARELRVMAARLVTIDEGTHGGGRPVDRPRGVIYIGFSAGGLAAVLAGSTDPATRGVITLDLVDQDDLALRAVAELDAPLVGLQGPPSRCNADGNGRQAFGARPHAALETVPGASHCDFEAPSGWLCELVCGDGRDDDDTLRAEIVRRVVTIATRLAHGRSGFTRESSRHAPVD